MISKEHFMTDPGYPGGQFPNQYPPPMQQPPMPPTPTKKPWYKRWWAITIFVIIGLSVLGNMLGGGNTETPNTPQPTVTATATSQAPETSAAAPETTPAAPETTAEQVPAEFKAALRSAKNYLNVMPFCKAGLFQQLTSEYGDKFPADAAQYAVDNVGADWNQQALKLAINYRDVLGMSNSAIWDQLVSEYGNQCLPEEADFAIANLPG